MARTVIRRLVACDEARGDVVIETGSFIDSCHIQRTAAGYVMEFVSGGRTMRCALAEFQARTEFRDGAREHAPVLEATAAA